jgi:hypothetical protein
MSTVNAPFGLRPAFHPSGLDRAQALANGIASGLASNILKGQAIKYSTATGVITPVTGTEAFSGAFAGCEFTDTTGRRRVSNIWPTGTTYQTGSCIAYFYNDQNIVYEIQANGVLAQTSLGDEANLTTADLAAGSTVTGLSQSTLSTTLVGTTVQGQMRIVDLAPLVDNAWGDAFTVVRAVVARSQFFGSVVAI